ncbi:hypothetical protein [Kitasatospora sp. NPDC087271]|uniref:hypothetical protein n=1 Tax=Kitasatospora sp. NPDC087271 TaxID=3364067 RepID=UPI0038239CD4
MRGSTLDEEFMEDFLDDPNEYDMDEGLLIAGVTTVPGGCVVTQPGATRRPPRE